MVTKRTTKKIEKKEPELTHLTPDEILMIEVGSAKAISRKHQIANANTNISLLEAKYQNAYLLLQVAGSNRDLLADKLKKEDDAYLAKVEELRKKYNVTKLGYDPISGEIHKG